MEGIRFGLTKYALPLGAQMAPLDLHGIKQWIQGGQLWITGKGHRNQIIKA